MVGVRLPSRKGFKRLSASLHVKGIPETRVARRNRRFKRLSASLHVKEQAHVDQPRPQLFQTPFGITACERMPEV